LPNINDFIFLMLRMKVCRGKEGRQDEFLWIGLWSLDNLGRRFRYEFQTVKLGEDNIAPLLVQAFEDLWDVRRAINPHN
jgi:hypothetical protein